VHAEPTTFGLKLTLMYDEVNRSIYRLECAKESISVGKLSGAVGTFAHNDPKIEQYVCKKLNLEPIAATQVIPRDIHARFLSTLAVIASSLERFATEIRHLQRTEVLEAEEPFGRGQKGSSAMPHKRNPVICERICGLARVIKANALAGFDNVALWHERDISHSSVERIIIPDSLILLDYMLHKTIEVFRGLTVYPENMLKNLERTGGLIFSQRVLLKLMEKGLPRMAAYNIVQKHALKAWKENLYFQGLISQDKAVTRVLKPSDLRACFDLKYYLRNIGKIYKKIGI
jgi:adenylosuccinate lyase